MVPTYADFTGSSPLQGNATVAWDGSEHREGRLEIEAGGSVSLRFELPDPQEIFEGTLVVRALATKLNKLPGFAPMSVVVNRKADRPVAAEWSIPGGGDLPHENTFVVPISLLYRGANEIRISSSARSTSRLWIYSITLDEVFDRGRSATALRGVKASSATTTYATRTRPVGSDEWTESAPLSVCLREGDVSVAVETISWREQNGTESSVLCNEVGFGGSRRLGNGDLYEYEGVRQDGRTDGEPVSYHVHKGWGGSWYEVGHLTVGVFEEVRSRLTSIAWRDLAGNQASAMFSADLERFAGFYQHRGEGRVGYSGRMRVETLEQ
ncbi:hypothetical protein [Actinophytocola oryzae]|uniref:OAA-family lectin sugar binding domain-containing protein n=1 Tax=Actinophytocola oryzae TaxID=502181 RepID=A0A4R7W6Z8_9PSEU|nr:hypothetical protein [Actinophytocola oryzae]TDV57948.1 hypothetical protein CLV71_101822 [Actinophytocola oryzae]